MANEIRKRLDLDPKAPISEIPPLGQERSQILREFEEFDKAFENIIFPKEKSG